MQGHAYAVAGAQGHEGLGNHRVAGNEAELKPLRQGTDHEGRFKQRKTLSNAAPRAISEWKVSSRGKTVRKSFEPAFGTERIWIVVIARIPMRHPLRHQNCAPRRKIIAAELARLNGSP